MVTQANNIPPQRLDLSLSHVQLDPIEVDSILPDTPKTPADEGKEFFLGERSADEQPIRVYELRLDPDGGPNKQRSASWPGFQFECSFITRTHSISVFHRPTCRTYYASPWMQERLPQRMACSKQTSRLMEACSSGISSRVEREGVSLTG